jgi:hypothetical protein
LFACYSIIVDLEHDGPGPQPPPQHLVALDGFGFLFLWLSQDCDYLGPGHTKMDLIEFAASTVAACGKQ